MLTEQKPISFEYNNHINFHTHYFEWNVVRKRLYSRVDSGKALLFPEKNQIAVENAHELSVELKTAFPTAIWRYVYNKYT